MMLECNARDTIRIGDEADPPEVRSPGCVSNIHVTLIALPIWAVCLPPAHHQLSLLSAVDARLQ